MLVKKTILFITQLDALENNVMEIRGGKYRGPWDHWSQKFFYAGRKKIGKEEKGGKKKRRERKKRRKEKERKKKERKRIEERVNAPISSHFVHGQTLGVGGARKIIYERTLIAECSLICR
jgi:hypothetical protein